MSQAGHSGSVLHTFVETLLLPLRSGGSCWYLRLAGSFLSERVEESPHLPPQCFPIFSEKWEMLASCSLPRKVWFWFCFDSLTRKASETVFSPPLSFLIMWFPHPPGTRGVSLVTLQLCNPDTRPRSRVALCSWALHPSGSLCCENSLQSGEASSGPLVFTKYFFCRRGIIDNFLCFQFFCWYTWMCVCAHACLCISNLPATRLVVGNYNSWLATSWKQQTPCLVWHPQATVPTGSDTLSSPYSTPFTSFFHPQH